MPGHAAWGPGFPIVVPSWPGQIVPGSLLLSPQQEEGRRGSSLPWGLSSELGAALGGPRHSAPWQPDSDHPRGNPLNHVGY